MANRLASPRRAGPYARAAAAAAAAALLIALYQRLPLPDAELRENAEGPAAPTVVEPQRDADLRIAWVRFKRSERLYVLSYDLHAPQLMRADRRQAKPARSCASEISFGQRHHGCSLVPLIMGLAASVSFLDTSLASLFASCLWGSLMQGRDFSLLHSLLSPCRRGCYPLLAHHRQFTSDAASCCGSL